MKKILLLLPFLVIFFTSAHAQMGDIDNHQQVDSTSVSIAATATQASVGGSPLIHMLNVLGIPAEDTMPANILALIFIAVLFFAAGCMATAAGISLPYFPESVRALLSNSREAKK